ncbi:tetratricopeptide repeat protein [Methanocalculus taiwanensis]|uniref:Tetratricopeptide repeat protein n=1 Tax=Methanocalculus taiwanensis TaxID=106207 RepID=A0ABD4TMV7_9EURY|nr:HEAT repeat domain-containing protein [Methanocalculus taiwanensis]MCQ1539333.1 tetratricopeptide repeat protein [Methanocalculus taiwanensis]
MEEKREDQARGEELIARARLERDPARKLFFATQAIALFPDDTAAWVERAKALVKSGMINEAEEQIDEVIRQNPDNGEGWYLHGIIKSIRGERESAKSSLQKAAGTLAQPGPAQYALGSILLNEGEYEEALRLFDAALTEDSRDPDTWFARGKVLLAMKRYNQAVISFDHVLEVQPGSIRAEEARRTAIRMMKQDLTRTDDRDFALLRQEADYAGLVRILTREKRVRALKAAEELIRLGTGSTPYIRPLLSHDDPEIRMRALHLLLAISDPRCARLFVKLALSIETPEEGGGEMSATLLDAISRALWRTGKTTAVEALRESLVKRDEKETIRAIRLVERTGGEEAVEQLNAASAHPSARVVFAALSALGAIGNEEAIDAIFIHHMSHDPSIRAHADVALRQVTRRSINPLMQRYASGDSGYRAFIREILHLIGGELVPAILKGISHEEKTEVREAFSDALAQAADVQSIPLLIDALESPEEGIRLALPPAFQAIGVPAVHPLIKALLDPRRRVSEQAGRILAKMGRTAMPSLMSALDSGDHTLRVAASDVLVLMGREALPALQDAVDMKIKDPDIIQTMKDLITLIKKRERMVRLLAEYRGEEPV